MSHATSPIDVSLGILAGGRGSRLGGTDKAWLQRGGIAQVLRIASQFAPQVGSVLVSANRQLERYSRHGLITVADRRPDAGPLAGLESLAHACPTPWLLTLPVDLVGVNECLLPSLAAAAANGGAYAMDDDGPQPLVALWQVHALRQVATRAIDDGHLAVQALQATLGMLPLRFHGVRFGNLNTAADLVAAGIDPIETRLDIPGDAPLFDMSRT